MLLMQHHQEALCERLYVIGIPHYAIKPFIDLLVKWEKCSGVEWTIKRLKGLKVDLIRRHSGMEPLSWIRKNRRGDIYGVVGSLFRWSDKSEKNFGRCVQAFMAYTYYILPGLTDTQKKKFLDGINPSVSDGLDESFHKDFSKSVTHALRKRAVEVSPRPLVTYQGSPEKKSPPVFGTKSIIQSEEILKDLQFFNQTGGLKLYQDFSELYRPLLVGTSDRLKWLDAVASVGYRDPSSNPPVYGGTIHFLQEPGGKLRSIASPLRLHQEALRPLGEELYGIVKSLPWDCSFDQNKAIPHIQSHLKTGGQISSIDLSSATDHFPLSLQITALKAIFDEKDWNHIALFERISRSEWRSPLGILQWTKGQPLGLYPSFAAFTLTHGLLLWHLNDCHFDNHFFVVGDDVVILSDKLRDRYLSMLDRMGCPYSLDKSLTSSKLSEFAGKLITENEVIPQLKWRSISNDNFLDIARLLGIRSRVLLNKRQKRVFDAVANLCYPIGLNFSKPGDNLVSMTERTLDFYRPVEFVLGSLMGLRKKLNLLAHTSSEPLDADKLQEISATFDEKVKSVVNQTIFSNFENVLNLGVDALASLPQALGLKPRLPFSSHQSVRISELERYERLL